MHISFDFHFTECNFKNGKRIFVLIFTSNEINFIRFQRSEMKCIYTDFDKLHLEASLTDGSNGIMVSNNRYTFF